MLVADGSFTLLFAKRHFDAHRWWKLELGPLLTDTPAGNIVL